MACFIFERFQANYILYDVVANSNTLQLYDDYCFLLCRALLLNPITTLPFGMFKDLAHLAWL
jgi:hypothetical protein